jgi:Na+/phosphate symporter
VAPALILIGVLMARRGTTSTRDLGRTFIGLGLMLMALRDLLFLVTPFEDVPSLRLLLGAVATQPVLDVVLAAGLTWAAHSSVAIVLLVVSLAAKGVVPPEAAFALVLGANLGTAINPCLEGGTADDPAAKRLPMGNLLNRLVGVTIALALLDPIGRLMVTVQPDPEAMSDADHRRVSEILAFVTNLEHAGAVVVNNLLVLTAKRIKRGLDLSKEGQTDLLAIVDRLVANLHTAATVFMTEDARAARLLAGKKEAFRDIEARATIAHFEGLRAGRIDGAETSALHLDILRDLGRANLHLVAAAAYPVLEGKGELLSSRLRQAEVNQDE